MAIAKIDGFQDGGTAVEPTTGNDVPVGALPNEVADDIDAKLSEGEFVIPADVVRYIGLERLMKLRDEAKKGLQRMAEIGQMGNAEDVGEKSNSTFEEEDEEGEEEDTGQFESDIDEILAEEDSVEGQTERMMAVGGLATMPFATGTDLTKAPKNPVFDVRYLKHTDGRVMYITYVNGKPLTPIPEGFKETTKEEAVKSATAADEAKKQAVAPAPSTVGDTGGPGTDGAQAPTTSTSTSMPGTLFGLTPMEVQSVGKSMQQVPSIPLMVLGKGLEFASGQLAQTATAASMGAVAADAAEQAPSSPATASMAASNAAVAAADAAINAGHSNAGSIAAANAAASAINSGATAAEAAQAGANAATQTDAATGMSAIAESGAAGAGPSDSGTGGIDSNFGMAKGGLVGKRKPKSKRGKGIALQK